MYCANQLQLTHPSVRNKNHRCDHQKSAEYQARHLEDPVVFTSSEPWRNDTAAMQRSFFYARLAIVLRNEKKFLEN